MSAFRIGFIGAGANTTSRHIPGLKATGAVEFVSVANRSPESSARVAAEFGIARVAPSPEALIADPDVDAVCIGTWPYKHREYTVAALAAGKHVLCEARMAGTLAEAREMHAAAALRPNLVAQLVPAPFDFRLGPTITRMIEEGVLGDIVEVMVTVFNGGGLDPARPAHWRERSVYSGRNVMMLGIFNEVLQRWLGDTTRVVASGRVVVPERTDDATGQLVPIDVPDSFGVFAEIARGARVTYAFSAVAQGAAAPGIALYGTRGTLHWTMGDTARWALHGEAWIDLAPDLGTDRGWRVEIDFVESVRDGAPVRLTTFDDGLRYMAFIDAAWKSWQMGVACSVETA
ncbi:MAG: Gfo/Idh/MocA family protein [Dehalococcoidia bacterium]